MDLTNEGDPYQDSYGHGTFVAGLIGGDGASSAGQYSGEAPAAKLVSIKVAGADGMTHLGTLISGLQWAVDHQSRYGIKILNLSLGFKSAQSTVTNPLDQAVEAVWNAGIAVVVSAGNTGPFNGSILSPGDDPLVITVGALDDMATASTTDDEMNDFSAVGPTSADGWPRAWRPRIRPPSSTCSAAPWGRASTSLGHFPPRSSASCSSATSLGLRTGRPGAEGIGVVRELGALPSVGGEGTVPRVPPQNGPPRNCRLTALGVHAARGNVRYPLRTSVAVLARRAGLAGLGAW